MQNQSASIVGRSDQRIEEHTTIEIELFSDQPNPRWTLTAAETAELIKKLKELPETPPASVPQTRGYRGFIALLPGNSLATPMTATIYHTTIQLIDTSTTRSYLDHDRSIEQWLLALAKAHVSRTIYEQLLQAIMLSLSASSVPSVSPIG